jgi:ferredoxin
MAVKVVVDPDRCQGHGRCSALAPDVFELDALGYSTVREGLELTEHLGDLVRRAAGNCPERAIKVETVAS